MKSDKVRDCHSAPTIHRRRYDIGERTGGVHGSEVNMEGQGGIP